MDTDTEKQILDELRSQTKLAKRAQRASVIALIFLAIFSVLFIASIALRDRIASSLKTILPVADSWAKARGLVDNGEFSKGEEMMRRLIAKYPDYYYGYRWMGFREQELGNFKEAEVNFRKACLLFPTEENEKALDAIRQAIVWKSKTANQVPEDTARKLADPQH